MSIQVYLKKGKKNYKEVKILNRITPLIEKQLKDNPNLKFIPARNFEELKELEMQFTATNVDYEEVSQIENNYNNKNSEEMAKKNELDEELVDAKNIEQEDDFFNDNSDFVDPFNREEPIVRDYVLGGNRLDTEAVSIDEGPKRTSFDEPTTFSEAFEMPGESIEPKQSKNTENKEKQEEQKEPRKPINPNFDEMSGARKKRSTKKFAKYIVEAVTMLSEKGFVWYANMDINDAKLAEYELKDVMDLSLLVNLDDGQEVTVKQFFQIQCLKAEQLSKIPQEEKDDLADALAEVLMEKGVGPTPTQELILISLKIFGGQALTLMALKSQTNSLLTQLKVMKQQEIEEAGGNYVPKQPSYQAPSNFEVEQEMSNPIERDLEQEQLQKEIEVLESRDPLMIGDSVDTIE
jgi:hypothetical protein